MSAVGGNYMSDGAIMAWVATQQNRLYGDLKSTMDLQEQRAQMTSDLADIKKNIEVANRHPENFPQVHREMQAFIAEYGDVPEFDELVATVREITTAVEKKLPGNVSVADNGNSLTQGIPTRANPMAKPGASLPVMQTADDHFADETIKDWLDTIDKKLDASGTNEQLGMIKVNELKSTIDQGTQMASQLIKSGNDSMNLILNNFV
jgi:hypothetical protein